MNAKKLFKLLYAAIKKYGEELELKIKTRDDVLGTTVYIPISREHVRIEKVKTKNVNGEDVEELVFVINLV